jgi:hypothetical protein
MMRPARLRCARCRAWKRPWASRAAGAREAGAGGGQARKGVAIGVAHGGAQAEPDRVRSLSQSRLCGNSFGPPRGGIFEGSM